MCKKYDEFISTREMVENIKDVLSHHKNEKIVFDNDVAGVLRMSTEALATRIARNSPPIPEILLFCNRTGLDINKIVFKKNC
jgi:hypothetical protein